MSNHPEGFDSRVERKRKPRKCPSCGFSPVSKILYGMPDWSVQFQEDVDAGRIIVGGCCVSEDDPLWQCSKCGLQIYKKRPQINAIAAKIRGTFTELSKATSLEKLLETLQNTEEWFNSYHLGLMTNKGLTFDPISGKYILRISEASSNDIGRAKRMTSKAMKRFIDSLPSFGGERPEGALVRSWDQNRVLIGGRRSTHTWRIVERSGEPFD